MHNVTLAEAIVSRAFKMLKNFSNTLIQHCIPVQRINRRSLNKDRWLGNKCDIATMLDGRWKCDPYIYNFVENQPILYESMFCNK